MPEKGGTNLPEQWIEIEETFDSVTREAELLAAFRRRYEAALWESPWNSVAVHAPACPSTDGGGECDCAVEVHVFQPALRRRIRLRGRQAGGVASGPPEES